MRIIQLQLVWVDATTGTDNVMTPPKELRVFLQKYFTVAGFGAKRSERVSYREAISVVVIV